MYNTNVIIKYNNMIEFRVANEEDVMDYLVALGEIPQNNYTFYHLYVDGVKKDNTLYITHLYDKTYCFGDVEQKYYSLSWYKPKSIQIANGLILIHKIIVNDDRKYGNFLQERQILVHSNGNILFEEDEKYTINNYYDIVSDVLFSIHKANGTTLYYRIGKDGLIPFFEGYEKMSSKNCVYGHPCVKLGKDTSVIYCINKNSLKVTLDG